MTNMRLGDCLLYAPATPDRAATLEALRQWRLKAPLSYYTGIRRRFADAGLGIATYEPSFVWPVQDEDIDRACQITKALGAISGAASTRAIQPPADGTF
jgi:hypothetical protein